MSSKRPAEDAQNTSPAKKQKLDNGVSSNGAAAGGQPKAGLPALDKIAKAKKVLELQTQLQAKLAAAKLKVCFDSAAFFAVLLCTVFGCSRQLACFHDI